ncbi:hypothetical protein A73_118 [Escherichia phage A73]|uniref:Uncharacterized protein n=1 Tax=Escherichia phage A73 TaxID=3003819 RepID=A0AAE9VX40_9CAUD|nr:hypothetical protein A73_118 [Escherichia phage A73]WBF77836.1 hypothetical protein W70_104 [Escherichia phage W70]
MSIFDGKDYLVADWIPISATRNIHIYDGVKNLNTTIIYTNSEEDREMQIMSVFGIDENNKIEKGRARIGIDIFDLSGDQSSDPVNIDRSRVFAHKEEQFTEELIKDLQMINTLFDNVHEKVKRVYL